ncbi:ferrous iron transport protein A [Desulfocicer vacuolatum DSM 3385]|uniref:Ferrous iron transport protein A n=1 Tax=Desulfocicer vacuolatum DSM 3385 TaxID=1121400 RepID=A0A1W1YT03_9BACT|nr:FeoA family protein [Desulfocicer vacuolatum]SMC39253.1 ferrous iron transport protein A [Desulfocicer vacuolatum DSM 3385]
MPGFGKGKNMRGRRHGKCCMLNDVPPGCSAKIHCHHAKGAVRQRLLDLGFVPQAEVDVIRRAPLGDPIECRVANYKVALRKSEADLIEIEYA